MSRSCPTFAELGIPFPLWEAPAAQSADYVGRTTCRLCWKPDQHCFGLSSGDCLMMECPNCHRETGVDVAEKGQSPCRHCGQAVPFPDLCPWPIGRLACCYNCLRTGRVALTKDTELGMITWESALEGVTHGVPGMEKFPGYEIVTVAEYEATEFYNAETWYGARLPIAWMWELLRTPAYHTWQGEWWRFCCGRPMIYTGEWSAEDFIRHAPDGDGAAYFQAVTDGVERWDWLVSSALHSYAFRCPHCGRHAAHCDMT